MDCGGSGFWCPACGEFYAQDSCGEASGADWLNARECFDPKNAKKYRLRMDEDFKVFCPCGEFLFIDIYEKEEAEHYK